MAKDKIGFIGGGNMAASLIGGLIADGAAPDSVMVGDVNSDRLAVLAQRFGVITSDQAQAIVEGCDVVVLAVKPQHMADVAKEIAPAVQRYQPLLITVAAGIRSGDLDRWLGGGTSIVRAMPNTPAMVGSGATALFAMPKVAAKARSQAEHIMRSVGLCVWVENEAQMDVVTALSGSGPAYFFLFMEAMHKAATELGLPSQTARMLTLETALGAARLALESDQGLTELRRSVTSPGGTTEQAIAVLQARDVESIVAEAITAAARRSQELARQFGYQN